MSHGPLVRRALPRVVTGLILLASARPGFAQPVNDDFANSIVLTGDTNVVLAVSTAHATAEPGEPNARLTGSQPSVWYSWTPPSDGLALLYYTGDDYPRYFGVFEGTRLRSLRRLSRVGSVVEFKCRAGKVIHIQVMAPTTSAAFDIHLEFTPRPANDNFANRFALEGVLVSTNGSTRSATREAREPQHNHRLFGQSVWYSWRAPASGWVRFEVVGDPTPLFGQVYVGDSVKRLREVPLILNDDMPSQGNFFAEAGVEYKLAIDGAVGRRRVVDNGPFTLLVDFSGLTLLTPTNGSVFLDPPAIELAVADLLPDLDGSLPEIAFLAADLSTSNETVLGTVAGSAGNIVWTNPPTGYFLLYARGTNTLGRVITSNPAEVAIRPLNDDFADRAVLEGTNVTWTVDFSGATREHRDPRLPKRFGRGRQSTTLWWTWTPPVGGPASLSCGDTTIPFAVYSGDKLGRFQKVLRPTSGSGQFEVDGGQSYQILLSTPSQRGAETSPIIPPFEAHLSLIGRPLNDDFAGRFPLEGVLIATNGTTVAATREHHEPHHNQRLVGQSVWYSWRAPASGWARFEVVGNSTPLLSRAYVGDSLNRLRTVPRTVVIHSNLPGVFHAEAGVDYKIAIDGEVEHKRAVDNGPFILNLDLSGLTLVSPTNGSVFVGPPQIEMTVADLLPDLDGSLTEITLFAEDLVEGGTSTLGAISGSASQFVWTNPPTGYFLLYARGSNTNGRPLTSNPVGVVVHPPNDDFANPSLLEGTNVTWTVDFSGATRQRNDPGKGPTLWWTWTAPADGVATLSCDQEKIGISVFSGEKPGRLRKVLGSISKGGEFDTVAGQTYQILLYAPHQHQADASSTIDPFDVQLEFTPRPANDNFANRFALEGVLVSTNGSTHGATREAREPRHNHRLFGQSVWYSWRAPASGWVRFEVVGDPTPLFGQVYVGESVSRLQAVPGPLIARSNLPGVFQAEAGVEYKLAIDGAVGRRRVVDNGPFTLTLDFSGLMLTSPTNGTVFVGPPEIILAAADLQPDLDGSLPELALFEVDLVRSNQLAIGTISGPAGQFSWTNPPTGKFLLYACGTNTDGRPITSNPVGVKVRPLNDDFANRVQLEGTNATVTVDFAAATRERKDPRVARLLHDKTNGPTLWWEWTAPVAGIATLKCDQVTIGFAVYSGVELRHLQRVMRPTAASGRFAAVGGQSYQIFLTDRSSPPSAPSRGHLDLTLTESGP